MQKQKFQSQLLKPKCVSVMIDTDPIFKKRVYRYEELNTKTKLSSEEKREKVILKDFIAGEIISYKKNSQAWILTNGPTGAGKKDYNEEAQAEA